MLSHTFLKSVAILSLSACAFAQGIGGTAGVGGNAGFGGGATAGAASTARLFNGSSDKMDGTGYLSGATTFTVAFWFKSADVAQTNRYLWVANNASPSIIYGYVNDGSGHAQTEFLGAGTGADPRPGSQITIADSNWHHVAYRYNGTEWAKFLDGTKTVINASITFATGVGGTPSYYMTSGSANFTNGLIARFLVSTTALTDGQIAALAGATCSSSGISGTVGYWLLDGTASPEPEHAPSPNTSSLNVTGTTNGQVGPSCSSN